MDTTVITHIATGFSYTVDVTWSTEPAMRRRHARECLTKWLRIHRPHLLPVNPEDYRITEESDGTGKRRPPKPTPPPPPPRQGGATG